MKNASLQHLINTLSGEKSEAIVTLAALIYLRWLDFQEGEQEAIAAFEGTSYTPALPSELHWRSWFDQAPVMLQDTLGYRLSKAIQRIKTGDNPLTAGFPPLSVVLKQLGQTDADMLASLVHWVAEQPFETPADRKRLLEYFDEIPLYATNRVSGAYKAPESITALVASLARPDFGVRIYAPCFGTARFLTAAVDYLKNREDKPSLHTASLPLNLYGVENDPRFFVTGIMRLALSGNNFPHLEWGNSLERTSPVNPERDGFDIVFVTPPGELDVPDEVANHYPIPSQSAISLLIQHALMQLRPGGKLVALVPEGLLVRGGHEKRLRKYLATDHTIEAVVSLPDDTFLIGVNLRLHILTVRRGGTTDTVRMVNGEHFFSRDKGNDYSIITPEAICQLTTEVIERKESPYSWNTDVESLATLDWDLVPRRRDTSTLNTLLAEMGPAVPVLQLGQCCEIQSSMPILGDDILDAPPQKSPVAYVSARDIQQGELGKPKAWLFPEKAALVNPVWKLRAGDLVMAKARSRNRTGIIRNGAIGAIPANNLLVLRPDLNQVNPHYLQAYLESRDCRAWMADHAHGGTIRFLTKDVITSLPFALPPLPIQERIAKAFREEKADAIEHLVNIIASDAGDPIAEWINQALTTLDDLQDDLTVNPLDLRPLLHNCISGSIFTGALQHAHTLDKQHPLTPWVLTLGDGIQMIRDAVELPKGIGLYSLLQETVRVLDGAKAILPAEYPLSVNARNLTSNLTSWMYWAMHTLASEVKLVVSLDQTHILCNAPNTITIRLHNNGPLPLRHLTVTTSPDWGKDKTSYLPDKENMAVTLNGGGPKKDGIFTMLVHWEALTLDGRKITENRELALEAVYHSTDHIENASPFYASPYICGTPIEPQRNDVFFGREDLITSIKRQISNSGNVILLEGNRRTGKSSILKHLEGKDIIPGWLSVYYSFQGTEGSCDGVGVTAPEIFREMAYRAVKSLQAIGIAAPLPNGAYATPEQKIGLAKACSEGISEAAPFSDFRDYIETVLGLLQSQKLSLVLMLDEFDKLQEGIVNGITSPQVPENLRFLVQTYPRLTAILSGSRRLKRLRENYWSVLFGLGVRFGVSALTKDAARRLITEPVNDILSYSPEAISRCIILTACQPFLLQCLCSRIFDMAAERNMRSITLDTVNDAADLFASENEHFASLWKDVGSDRRRLILALCHQESEKASFSGLSGIQEQLYGWGIPIDGETLITDLELLMELELIQLKQDGTQKWYAPAIPLMGIWINHQQDIIALKTRAQMEADNPHE